MAFTPEHHLGHFGEEHSEAQDIHDEFHIHEEGLRNRTEKRQKRAKRQTELRLIARRKLKDSKALHRVPAFSDLTDDEVNTLIDQMEHITRFKNDAICHQHDVSDSFYIIVKGSAVATVDDDDDATPDEMEYDAGGVKCRTVAETCPNQIEVGRISELEFFGEGSLVVKEAKDEEKHGKEEDDGTCSATVTVDSDRCELLRLKRKNFLAMNENSMTFRAHHEDHQSVLEQLNVIKMKRVKSNRIVLEQRKNSKQMVTSEGNGEVKNEDDDALLKSRDLKEKDVPTNKKKIVPLGRPKTTSDVVTPSIGSDFSFSRREDQEMGSSVDVK